MSTNLLPRRKQRALAPNPPPEPIAQPAQPKVRKTNIGDAMRRKNKRMTMPKV